MAHNPVSILDSLAQALPIFPFDHDPQAKVSEGAHSTLNMPPPKIAIPRDPAKRWHLLGMQDLNPNIQVPVSFAGQLATIRQHSAAPRAREAIAYAEAFLNKRYSVPEKEVNIHHSNEADIVRSANLYLIHPVLLAISAHPRYYHKVVSKSEDIQGDTRTDITLYEPRPGGASRGFLVSEYKMRQTFKGYAFDHRATINASIPSWGSQANVPNKLAEILYLVQLTLRPGTNMLWPRSELLTNSLTTAQV